MITAAAWEGECEVDFQLKALSPASYPHAVLCELKICKFEAGSDFSSEALIFINVVSVSLERYK